MFRLLAVLLTLGALLPATASAAVVLNEVNCTGSDWIEVANTSKRPADVSGWVLTDDELPGPRASHVYTFREGRSIPPRGYVLIRKRSPRFRGLPFGISCGKDTIRLARSVDDLKAVDEIAVPKLMMSTDTYGRVPTRTGAWRETTPTKRAANRPSALPGTTGDTSWLFDPTAVHEIAMTLPQSSVDALNAQPREGQTYVPGTFTLKGAGVTYGPYQVGVRLKGGSGSFRRLAGKAAFKVDFNRFVKGQTFHGLDNLTLNNMHQDPSMLHEAISYEAFRTVGLPASRTGYAFVNVNGADFGLYVNVETIDKTMLRRWPRWFSSTRHLYEGEVRADVTPERAASLQVDEGDEANRSDLDALVGALANAAAPYSQRMAPVVDLTQLTYFWAVEKYVGHQDGYAHGFPNNFFLHSDMRGRFRMLPWGMDQTLEDELLYDSHEDGGGQLFNACLAEPACRQRYFSALADVGRTLEAHHLENRLDQIAAAIRPWQERDPRRKPSMDEVSAAIAQARAFLVNRPASAAAAAAANGGAAPGA